MTLDEIGDRRKNKVERRKQDLPIDFPDRRDFDRRQLQTKRKKIIILGFTNVDQNRNVAEHMHKMVREHDMDEHVEVEQSAELLDFVRYGVILAPGVIVDGKLKCAGRRPTKEEVKKWLGGLQESINRLSESLDDIDDEQLLEDFDDTII